MSRALRRHHRERIIAKRYRVASLQLSATWHDFHYWHDRRPLGKLARTQAWLGCGRARCGLCHPSKRWHTSADRMRADQDWRREWEA